MTDGKCSAYKHTRRVSEPRELRASLARLSLWSPNSFVLAVLRPGSGPHLWEVKQERGQTKVTETETEWFPDLTTSSSSEEKRGPALTPVRLFLG